MKVLLFGKNGQVGWEIARALQPVGNVISFGREDADFLRPEILRETIQTIRPDIIVNAVAYTAVDKAEDELGVTEMINGITPGVLAEETLKIGALLIHYSTDYVFDGTKKVPYIEIDKPNPLNVYGSSKLAGEVAIQTSGCDYLILRTSWVFASRGSNFLLTILKYVYKGKELSVVSDQIGAPTSAKLIAETTVSCIKQSMYERETGDFRSDLYHLTATGYTSWHGFAKEILRVSRNKLKCNVNNNILKSILAADYFFVAKRPMNSRLDVSKLEKKFNVTMPEWKDGLVQCENEIDFDVFGECE